MKYSDFFRKLSAAVTAGIFASLNLAFDTPPPQTMPDNTHSKPVITKIKVKSENSPLNFLPSGIFGREKVTVTIYAKDSNNLEIKDINLYNNSSEIESSEQIKYDPSENAYFLSWILDNGSYNISANAVTENNSGEIYSINLTQSPEKLNEKDFTVSTGNTGTCFFIENTSPALEIHTVHTDANNTCINLDELNGKYIDGEFYAYKDNEKIWTNSPFNYLVTSSDENSGIYSISYKSNDLSEYTEIKAPESTQKNFSCLLDSIISVKTEDNSGNISEITPPSAEIDNTAPIVSIDKAEIIDENDNIAGNYTENKWTDKRIRITVSADDLIDGKGSGTEKIELSEPNEKISLISSTQNGKKLTNVYIIEPNFEGTLKFSAYDNVNNKSSEISYAARTSRNIHGDYSDSQIITSSPQYSDIDGNPLYSSDQTVKFKVTDSHAGIREIKWYVRTSKGIVSGSDTMSDFNSEYGITDGWTTAENNGIITDAEKNIKISENENNIEIGLCFSDNDGFETPWEVRHISIDKTKPEIVSVKFNDKNNSGKKYYNHERTAVVTVKERNINSADISAEITNSLTEYAQPYTSSSWKLISNKSNTDADGENLYQMTVTFHSDAEYKFSVTADDLTGKKSDKSKTSDFIIDKTAPVVKISYDNNEPCNNNYYNKDRTATITINEHNFSQSDVKIALSAFAEDNITKIKSSEIIPNQIQWTQSKNNKDEWTASVKLSKEGKYSLSAAYTDPAKNSSGNVRGEVFYIDKTAPKLEQTFTEKDNTKNAVNGSYVPKITLSDFNLGSENQALNNCDISINKLDVNGNTEKSFNFTSDNYKPAEVKKEAVYEMIYNIFQKNPEIDGIYNISISASDLAGNTVKSENLTVSVNRNGSTFELVNQEAKNAVDKFNNGSIPINEKPEVEIREINVSPLVGESTITITRDNKKMKALEKGDYTIVNDKTGENKNGWYETVYKISKKNFSFDGIYTISIDTNDEAGNSNKSDKGKNKCVIKFIVDSSAPEIVIAGVKDGANLKETEVNLRIICSDKNLDSINEMHGDDMVITMNKKKYNLDSLEEINAEIKNDEAGSIIVTMPVVSQGKNSKNNISVTIRDKADNFSNPKKNEVTFRLSSSFLVRNGTAAIILIIAVVIALGADIYLMTRKIKKHE